MNPQSGNPLPVDAEITSVVEELNADYQLRLRQKLTVLFEQRQRSIDALSAAKRARQEKLQELQRQIERYNDEDALDETAVVQLNKEAAKLQTVTAATAAPGVSTEHCISAPGTGRRVRHLIACLTRETYSSSFLFLLTPSGRSRMVVYKNRPAYNKAVQRSPNLLPQKEKRKKGKDQKIMERERRANPQGDQT
jgi:hypothetical protein